MELSNDTVFWIATGSYVIMLSLFAFALRSKEKQNVQLRADVYKFKNIADQREVVYGQMAEKAARLERLSRERGQQVDNMVEQCRVMDLRNEGLARERDQKQRIIDELNVEAVRLQEATAPRGMFLVVGGEPVTPRNGIPGLSKPTARTPLELTIENGDGAYTLLRRMAFSNKNKSHLNEVANEANKVIGFDIENQDRP